MRHIFTCVLCCATFLLVSQPISYYNSLDLNVPSEQLKAQLSFLISSTHIEDLPYTSNELDTWDVIRLSDEVLYDTDFVYLFYGYDNDDGTAVTDYTRLKESSCHTSGCTGLWNREHVFAKSLAEPNLETYEPGPGTDVHNLRACDGSMNSSKGNRLFQDDVGNAHITNQGEWYPGDEWKGDVARIIMYMFLRYPDQCLANNTALSTNNNHSDMPDVLLEWNAEDPVSEVELNRNNVLETFQGNRNPFIDNPYLATMIWGGAPAEDTWNLLSVASKELKSWILMHPNPTSDILKIRVENERCINSKVVLINLFGQRLQEFDNPEIIDVRTLASGSYFLQINCRDQRQVLRFNKI